MKASRPGIATVLFLAGLSVIFLAVLRSAFWNAAGAVCVGLLATELDRSGRYLGLGIVRGATLLLPARLRGEAADEWSDHVLAAGEQGIRPMLVAVSIALLAAPRMAVRFRLRPWVARLAGDVLYAYASTVSITLRGFGRELGGWSQIQAPEGVDPAEVERLCRPHSVAEAVAMSVMLFVVVLVASVAATIAAPATPIGFVSSRWVERKARVRAGIGLLGWAGYGALIVQPAPALHYLGLALAVLTVGALAAPVCLGMMGGEKNTECAASRLLAWIEGRAQVTSP